MSNENLKKLWYLLENNNMRIFNTGQISPSEKQDILNKHRTSDYTPRNEAAGSYPTCGMAVVVRLERHLRLGV